MAFKKIQAYAIVNNGVMFSVFPTKEQAKLEKKLQKHPKYFKIVKLELI